MSCFSIGENCNRIGFSNGATLSTSLSHLAGALAALGSAFLWAVSAILFRRLGDQLSALALNVGKGVIALLGLGALVLLQGWVSTDPSTLVALALSGVLGIALGDTLYFLALVRLGARVTLVVSCLIPVLTAIAAMFLFNESLGWAAMLGIGFTLVGVGLVLWEQAPSDSSATHWRSGLVFAALFVSANAGAILLTKVGVAEAPAIQATLIRQLAALAALTFWVVAMRAGAQLQPPLKNPKLLGALVIAAIIGALLGTWLSVAALKYTHAGVAAALNSTSPLFVLPLAALWLKEQVSTRAVLGATVAVGGIAVYFSTLS